MLIFCSLSASSSPAAWPEASRSSTRRSKQRRNFRIIPDYSGFSGFFRVFPDYSGFSGIFPGFSGFFFFRVSTFRESATAPIFVDVCEGFSALVDFLGLKVKVFCTRKVFFFLLPVTV
jgi:hypothetical protein